jgi:hypothetical protein
MMTMIEIATVSGIIGLCLSRAWHWRGKWLAAIKERAALENTIATLQSTVADLQAIFGLMKTGEELDKLLRQANTTKQFLLDTQTKLKLTSDLIKAGQAREDTNMQLELLAFSAQDFYNRENRIRQDIAEMLQLSPPLAEEIDQLFQRSGEQ